MTGLKTPRLLFLLLNQNYIDNLYMKVNGKTQIIGFIYTFKPMPVLKCDSREETCRKTVDIWFSYSGFFPELRRLNESVGVTNIPVQPQCHLDPCRSHICHTSHHLEEACRYKKTHVRQRLKPKVLLGLLLGKSLKPTFFMRLQGANTSSHVHCPFSSCLIQSQDRVIGSALPLEW